MSTNRLGRTENFDQLWSRSHRYSSETKVEIHEPEREQIEGLPEVENYPYSGQESLRGTFDYHYTDWSGENRQREGEYEYRTGSGLLLINIQPRFIKAEDVISEIDSLLEESDIDSSLSVKRRPLWNFFERADQYRRLVISGPNGTFDFTTLKHVANSISPSELDELERISESEAEKRFKEPAEVKRVIPILREIDLDAEIESFEDLGLDPRQYIINQADVAFQYQDETITVKYDRGELDIDNSATKQGREFVIELFEKDVIYPSYGF